MPKFPPPQGLTSIQVTEVNSPNSSDYVNTAELIHNVLIIMTGMDHHDAPEESGTNWFFELPQDVADRLRETKSLKVKWYWEGPDDQELDPAFYDEDDHEDYSLGMDITI